MATKAPVKSAPLQKPSTTKSTSVAVKKPTSSELVSIKDQMTKDLATLAGKTAPASGNAIRVTQDKQFILPDGTKTQGPIDVVIVDFCSFNALYPGPYDKNNIVPPICFAVGDNPGDLVPSAKSPEKQSDGCAACPMNQFSTAATGGGKACKNTRKLAILAPDSDMETAMWTLSVSATALKGFDAYVNSVARQLQVPPYGVVTSVSFDPKQDYPTLVFSDPQPNQNVEIAYSRRQEAAELLAVEPDVSSYVPVVKKPQPARRK